MKIKIVEIVPVVSKKVFPASKCPTCGGTGTVKTEYGNITCPSCSGTGEVG